MFHEISYQMRKPPNAGLQLRRAISIQAEGTKLFEKHAIAPSAARLCYAAALPLTVIRAIARRLDFSTVFFLIATNIELDRHSIVITNLKLAVSRHAVICFE